MGQVAAWPHAADAMRAAFLWDRPFCLFARRGAGGAGRERDRH